MAEVRRRGEGGGEVQVEDQKGALREEGGEEPGRLKR